jgi:hypothetical protein
LNLTTRVTLSEEGEEKDPILLLRQAVKHRDILLLAKVLSSSNILDSQDNLDKKDGYKVIKTLHELAELPLAEKRQMLLFIPQSNRAYWTLSANFCKATPFIAPAISGIAMLDGLPSASCETRYYGYGDYKVRTEQQQLHVNNLEQLCAYAHSKNFTLLAVLDSDITHNISLRRIVCP